MSLNNTIDMSVNLEKQPDRNGRGSKRISRPPILSNFQKHESLVATDMGDSLKKWPTNQKLNQQQARGGVSLIKKKALRATKLNPLKKDTLQKAPVLAYEPNPTEAVEDLLEAHISPNASPKMNPSSLVNDRTMRGNHTTHEDPSELQLLLRRAEGLLSQVTKATSAHTSSSIPSPSSQYENIPGPPVMTSSRPLAVATDAQISEIDLLISGLPDAYEEPEIDDDAVQRLLSLGGVPPSQLEYHSLYAVNQTILKKLNEVKYLHLHLNNVIIFGKKFGVRKNFSFLTVKGPEGATIHCNNIRSIHLNDKKFKIDSDMRKSSHQLNSASRPIKMEPFLVGEVNLDESLSWEISFNETLLHSWRESSRLSRSVRSDCLRIELFSTIVPPGKDGKWEPVCFAAAYLPLFGLLALESLAAAVTCDFEVNPLVYQLVQARMQNLPLGLRRTSTGFDRGEDGELIRLGTLSGSVWLETHDQSSIRSAEMKDRATLPPLMSEIVQQRPLSGSSEESMIYQERREREEGLSSALNYIPKEMPSTAQDGQRYLGMAFISIRLDLIFDQLSYGSPYKVIVAYKESKR